jgi:succinate dehydrogenase/fumarate reductase flavoprotein subunit
MKPVNDAPESVDVIVVGGGGSGLAAAVEAAQAGARVLLLEKTPALGGTTMRSVGSVTATGTPHQRAAGIADNTQGHFEDMVLFADQRGLAERDNPALRRLLVDESPGMVEWLSGMGVVFFGPMPEPPHRLPRMHNVLPHSRSYIHHLAKRARSLGAQLRTGTRVLHLVQEAGRIAGVEVEDGAGQRRILARRGVVLASGDFSASDEMKALFLPPPLAAVEGINPASTGDGQRMVLEVGGEIVNGDIVWGPELRFVAPPAKGFIERIPTARPVALAMRWAMKAVPQRLLRPFLMMFVTTNLAPSMALIRQGSILVNREGRRFVDERQPEGPQTTIPLQTDRVAWFVIDGRVARAFETWPTYISTAPGVAYAYLSDYRRNRRDIFHQAATLDELAAKIGVPAAALRQTVAEYNQAVPAGLTPLDQPPFIALGPVKSWVVFGDGGARIDERFQVLDTLGHPIPGLYAAGSAGQGGVLLEGHGHHLGWAFVSGRLAGRSAAGGGV